MCKINEKSWQFPIQDLEVESAVLCLHKPDDQGEIYSEGGRIEFHPIELPDINYAYEQTESVCLNLYFSLPRFSFRGLDQLARTIIRPSEEQQMEESGSTYAFSAHNPVDTIEARFGDPTNETIPVELNLRFDFDYEGTIGGTFNHVFRVVLTLEKRWGL